MTTYRIVCTQQQPASAPPQHAHIVAIGTGTDSNRATESWTLAQVIQKMDAGDKFYTQGITSGKSAWVEKYFCSPCRQHHIRSNADATKDNNLDSLRTCNWQK